MKGPKKYLHEPHRSRLTKVQIRCILLERKTVLWNNLRFSLSNQCLRCANQSIRPKDKFLRVPIAAHHLFSHVNWFCCLWSQSIAIVRQLSPIVCSPLRLNSKSIRPISNSHGLFSATPASTTMRQIAIEPASKIWPSMVWTAVIAIMQYKIAAFRKNRLQRSPKATSNSLYTMNVLMCPTNCRKSALRK